MTEVEILKKITLHFQAGTADGAMDLRPRQPQFEFIFGLGSAGMTPFEYELAGKTEGDEIALRLTKDTFHEFFEHLDPPVADLFDGGRDVYLKVKIVKVAAPDPREVVKAMAEMARQTESGCAGGDCGCGCGCSG